MGHPQARSRADLAWIAGATAAVLVSGMAFSLWLAPLIRHHEGFWLTPGDIWYTVRTAHWIGWGDLSFVYSNNRSALVTLPGFNVVLTPLVILSSALHLSELAPGLIGPPKPTEWLVVGSFSMLCAGPLLGALDNVARRLRIPARHRRALLVAEGAALWPTVVLWGHPEDALALAFAVYALLMVVDGRWTAAGWLFGCALSMQLLVVMMVPVLIGLAGWRRGAAVLTRAAVLPGFLLVAVLVPDFHDAWWVLSHQPSVPSVNHVTPWVDLAPSLDHGLLVGGGIGRLLNGVVAIGAGLLAWRWRDRLERVIWITAVALAARTAFEAVMVAYYVMPGVALALVVAARVGRLRALGAVVAAGGLTAFTFTHHGEWEYWLSTMALTAVMLALAWPTETSRSAHAQRIDPEESQSRTWDALVHRPEPAHAAGTR